MARTRPLQPTSSLKLGTGQKTTLELDRLKRSPHLPLIVARSISREIALKRLKPGDRLPTEQALAATFGVSRNVVREAVARLRSEGLIFSRPGRGAFVSEATSTPALRIDTESMNATGAFENLFELRGMLEVQAAALAAVRRTTADLRSIAQAVATMSGTLYGSVAWIDHDLAFHRAIAEATYNPYTVQVLEFLSSRTRDSILACGRNAFSQDLAQVTIDEHEAIVVELERQDPQAAAAAMRSHIVHAAARVGLTLPLMPLLDAVPMSKGI